MRVEGIGSERRSHSAQQAAELIWYYLHDVTENKGEHRSLSGGTDLRQKEDGA
jgi:hypothetical protein